MKQLNIFQRIARFVRKWVMYIITYAKATPEERYVRRNVGKTVNYEIVSIWKEYKKTTGVVAGFRKNSKYSHIILKVEDGWYKRLEQVKDTYLVNYDGCDTFWYVTLDNLKRNN